MVLCFASAVVFTKPFGKQIADYVEFGKKHGYDVPGKEAAQRAYINALVNVFGETRKGRTPSCIRSTVTSYYGHRGGWKGHSKLTPEFVHRVALQLKSVADVRFGIKTGGPERADVAE